ncbi:DUF2911 domain-containing protein [Arachidicoccus sp.]|jgi:hypothetical protein|uniref:DUF2911 domain-containing protein n=1 Tax=Arachidicoccus sp. TaxID=1872624 RepID=UPI003D2615E4
MKKLFSIFFIAIAVMLSLQVNAQAKKEDKSKRPSPPALVTQTIKSGATISIDYSQPAVKGRTIGKDLEPLDGKVWRTGANEATVFTTDKDVTIDGHSLPAGKYGLFTLFEGENVSIIFNKTWKQWGAFKYDATQDQLRVKTTEKMNPTSTERMTFTIGHNGLVTLLWGKRKVTFMVK